MSSAAVSIVASLVILSLLVAALVCCRIVYTDTFEHTAILWNLALAWMPLGLALVIWSRAVADASFRVLAVGTVFWLVLLPNAPYMLTDLKYVGAGGRVPVLYDALLFSAAAWTGLLLGFTSVFLMHAVARRVCSATTAWVLVVCALGLSSFGIYLGRVPRANSWDLLLRPAALTADTARGLQDPRAILLTALVTAFLLAGYLAIYSLGARAQAFWRAAVERSHLRAGESRKPRLLILITLAEAGGAQTSVSLLLPELARQFDVTLAAHGSGPLCDATRTAGIPFVPLKHLRRPIHPWHDLLGLIEVTRLCRRVRPDIVHAHSSKAGLVGCLAAAIAGVPIRVFTVHGWSFAAYGGFSGRLFLWAERLLRPLRTSVICVSNAVREQGVTARACRADRTLVVHNAVDLASFPKRARAS